MITFSGRVDDKGVLYVINRKGFDNELLNFVGKDVTITVNKKVKKRSNPLNAYYWSGVVPILMQRFTELGHRLTKEEVHQFLKMRFLKVSLSTPEGEYLGDRIKSTTELGNAEFMDYLEQIKQFASETLDIYIPDPNEQLSII